MEDLAEILAFAESSGTRLTKREAQVAALIRRGASNQAVADALGVSVRTVKFHVSNILEKFQVPNRWALERLLSGRGG